MTVEHILECELSDPGAPCAIQLMRAIENKHLESHIIFKMGDALQDV